MDGKWNNKQYQLTKQKGEKTLSQQAGHGETNSKHSKCKYNYIKITCTNLKTKFLILMKKAQIYIIYKKVI